METQDRTVGLFRASNEHTFNVLWGIDAESGDFLCECKGAWCQGAVWMTLSEYTRTRDRHELVCAPGHEVAP